jgi:anti-sigma factor RsiW
MSAAVLVSTRGEQAHLTEEQANDYVDGILISSARAEIDAHLTHCERCRREVAELSDLVTFSRQTAREAQAPPALWPVIAALTIHHSAATRKLVRLHKTVIVTVIGALIGLTSLTTGWLVNACTEMRRPVSSSASFDVHSAQSPFRHANARGACTAEWYLAMRDAAWLRAKQLRNNVRHAVRW